MNYALVQTGQDLYKANREKWEIQYPGKIIAIDVESRKLAGVGNTIDAAYYSASVKNPGKRFYFRRVGLDANASTIQHLSSMSMPCREYGVRVVRATIAGPKVQRDYEAYVDPSNQKSLMAENEAERLQLPYVGDVRVKVGSVSETMRLFKATVYFLNEKTSLITLGAGLLNRGAIKIVFGRDFLAQSQVPRKTPACG